MLFKYSWEAKKSGSETTVYSILQAPLYSLSSLCSNKKYTSDERVVCLWVEIRENASKADVMVGGCYRPPRQHEEADAIFYKQGEVS